MKKFLVILTILIVLGAIAAIIITNKEKASPKFLTVKTNYNYVYTETKLINIRIYSNYNKHALLYKENIVETTLYNDENNKLISLNLLDITKGHEEIYLGDNYYSYTFSFEMPRLASNFKMEDANLKISLLNNDEYNFPIGKVNLLYLDDISKESYFKVVSLYGFKEPDFDFARLNKIIIEFEPLLEFEFKKVSIGDDELEVSFSVENNKLELLIPRERSLLNNPPLIITLDLGSVEVVQVIDNFTYFEDFETLKESGDLIYVSVLDPLS